MTTTHFVYFFDNDWHASIDGQLVHLAAATRDEALKEASERWPLEMNNSETTPHSSTPSKQGEPSAPPRVECSLPVASSAPTHEPSNQSSTLASKHQPMTPTTGATADEIATPVNSAGYRGSKHVTK